jgi:hypothetical protein
MMLGCHLLLSLRLQLKALQSTYLKATGKTYSTLNGTDLVKMKNIVCGISPVNILWINTKAYR